MANPWYEIVWIPGTLLGCAIGIFGGVIGVQASRNNLRAKTVTWMIVFTIASGIFLVTGVVLLVTGQPWGLWYGLLSPGFFGLLSLGVLLPVVRKRVRDQTLSGG